MSLDIDAWQAICKRVAAHANRGCGLSYDYYVDLFSAAIDGELERLPEAHRTSALHIATDEWSYATPAEREEAQQSHAENGCCSHGITLGCCPAGCGSGPDD